MIQLKIGNRRIGAISAGRIATIPLIIVMVFWELTSGFVADVLAGFTPSRQGIEYSLIVDVPLILITIGVWLSCYRFFLWLGRIGTIIWLLPFGLCTIIILGELEHAEPIALVVYFIVLLSTVSVVSFLWKKEKGGGT